jgi:hypothetical protein
MYILENGIRLNKDLPFRHGVLLGGLFDDSELVVRLDIADPIGVELTDPIRNRPFTFSKPSVGMMMIRKSARSSSTFFPALALAKMQAGAGEMTKLLGDAWAEMGGDANGIARNQRALVSALNGQAHSVSSFGTSNWAPSLVEPFGLVMSGDWMGIPELGEPLSYTVKEEEDA